MKQSIPLCPICGSLEGISTTLNRCRKCALQVLTISYELDMVNKYLVNTFICDIQYFEQHMNESCYMFWYTHARNYCNYYCKYVIACTTNNTQTNTIKKIKRGNYDK